MHFWPAPTHDNDPFTCMCAGFASNLVGFTRTVNILRHGLNYATRSVRTARDSVASVSATIKRALFASHAAQRGASAPGAVPCGGSSRTAVAPLLDDAYTAFGIILKQKCSIRIARARQRLRTTWRKRMRSG